MKLEIIPSQSYRPHQAQVDKWESQMEALLAMHYEDEEMSYLLTSA